MSEETTTTSESVVLHVPPPQPLLVTDQLRLKIIVEDTQGVYPTFEATVRPMTEEEMDAYELAASQVFDHAKKETSAEELMKSRDLRNATILAHLKSWSMYIAPSVRAEINAGTVAALPRHAKKAILDGILMNTGTLLGN